MCRAAGLPGSYGQTWPDGYFRVRDLIEQIKMDIFGIQNRSSLGPVNMPCTSWAWIQRLKI
jgi:hypothetical protein